MNVFFFEKVAQKSRRMMVEAESSQEESARVDESRSSGRRDKLYDGRLGTERESRVAAKVTNKGEESSRILMNSKQDSRERQGCLQYRQSRSKSSQRIKRQSSREKEKEKVYKGRSSSLPI